MKNKDCENCEYCRAITAQDGFEFYGCRHTPYKGRWIAEIEECPKERGGERMKETKEKPKSYPEEYGPFDLDNR